MYGPVLRTTWHCSALVHLAMAVRSRSAVRTIATYVRIIAVAELELDREFET
jgi:hypothetical protein